MKLTNGAIITLTSSLLHHAFLCPTAATLLHDRCRAQFPHMDLIYIYIYTPASLLHYCLQCSVPPHGPNIYYILLHHCCMTVPVRSSHTRASLLHDCFAVLSSPTWALLLHHCCMTVAVGSTHTRASLLHHCCLPVQRRGFVNKASRQSMLCVPEPALS